MPFVPAKMGALLIPSGPGDRLHLHAILTNPCPDGQHLLASVTSIGKSFHDPACVLRAGDHPFIEHDSYVLYRRMLRVQSPHLENCVNKGLFVEKDQFHPDVFQRICDGVAASRFAPRGMKNYFSANKD